MKTLLAEDDAKTGDYIRKGLRTAGQSSIMSWTDDTR
jgi:hypothetical protein